MIHSVFGWSFKGKRRLNKIIAASMASGTVAKSMNFIFMIIHSI